MRRTGGWKTETQAALPERRGDQRRLLKCRVTRSLLLEQLGIHREAQSKRDFQEKANSRQHGIKKTIECWSGVDEGRAGRQAATKNHGGKKLDLILWAVKHNEGFK